MVPDFVFDLPVDCTDQKCRDLAMVNKFTSQSGFRRLSLLFWTKSLNFTTKKIILKGYYVNKVQ